MNPKVTPQLKALAIIIALSGGLAACHKANQPNTETAQDQTATTAKADASDARDQTTQMGSATGKVEGAVDEAKMKAKEAGNAISTKASDALITTEVNAKLAQDPKLSALKINVDTKDGKVELTGKAPDQGSRQRATELAMSVEGVVDVDNELVVSS
jgi:osmotically-inducible protein OsmY